MVLRFDTRGLPLAGLDRSTIRRLCAAVLRGEGVAERCAVGVSLVDDDEIARLNGHHRGLHGATDVLSFPLDAPTAARGEQPAFVVPSRRRRELGDVVVSVPRVLVQAREYGHSPRRELAYLITHGLLHILGHDHEDEADRAIMREREEAALAEVGLTR